MVFRVEVAPRAVDDIEAIAGYIAGRESIESAEKWFANIHAALRTLSNMPGNRPVVSESEEVGMQVRVLLFGPKNRTYKVFYSIELDRRVVRVVHVRHWARRMPAAGELDELGS